MADAVISYALTAIADGVVQEIALRSGVSDELQWLERELRFMRAYIQDAEARAREPESMLVRQWLHDLQELSRDAAMTLNSFKQPRTMKHYILHLFTSEGRRVSKQIKSFRQSLGDLQTKRELYGIQRYIGNPDEGTSSALRRSYSNTDEEDLIGFVDIAETIQGELLSADPSRTVVSIYGMGGLGKTALARKLYHSNDVGEVFECRAWVYVSQNYTSNDLVRMAIASLTKGMTTEDLGRLRMFDESNQITFLRKYLESRRYLLVVDDVWDENVWKILKRAFPNNSKHSRVILTTRIKAVGMQAGGFVHKLRFLEWEESWNLFCKEVNLGMEDKENLAMAMVRKCCGLPLAITQLREVLKWRNDLAAWKKMNDEDIWEPLKRHMVRKDSTEISDLLTLSFDNLAGYEERSLFLNMGMFPCDHEVDINKLISMWLTEPQDSIGSLGQKHVQIREEGAEEFINELIDRNLIVEEGSFWGKPTTCKVMHDLLRDLVIQKAKEVSYFDIFPPRYYSGSVVPMPSIRHAIHGQEDEYVNSQGQRTNRKLRMLLFFNAKSNGLKAKRLAYGCAQFHNLEVLDLKGIDFRSAEDSLSEMLRKTTNLKHLGLADTFITSIPLSIKYHKDLQILDTGSNSICPIPIDRSVCELDQLRHLHGFFKNSLYDLRCQSKLQSLRVVYNRNDLMSGALMYCLQELSLRFQEFGDLDIITKLTKLTTLVLSSCISHPGQSPLYARLPSLECLSSCKRLSNLWLDGSLLSLPACDEFPRSLQRLILSRSTLKDDPMPRLEMLPNLISLELMDAYEGNKMVCSKNQFRQLEYLYLSEARNLEVLEVQEGAMPRIEGLTIAECPQLVCPQRFHDFPRARRTKSIYGVPKYTNYN